MKTKPCYSDLDEFWVVGDFVAKAFMGWGGERRQCYVDFGDPSEAERFSTYMEARKFMKSDEDAAEWVKEHGGSRFAKPLRCRMSVIVYPVGGVVEAKHKRKLSKSASKKEADFGQLSDVAKLREALSNAVKMLESIFEAFPKGTISVYISDVAEVIDNARAVLSAPPRC